MTNIPTISQLYTSTIADLQTQYGNTISPVGQVLLRAIAGVWAAKLRVQYLLNAKVQKNIFADTAESEANGGTLERNGRIKLGRNPFQAVAGNYRLRVTGTTGATIPASITFKSDDSSLNPGYLFVLDAAYTLSAPIDSINVRALTAGTESKLNISDTLTVTAPIALVDSIASVTVINTPPLAAEDLELYRQNILNSYRLEAQGGAATDYRLWAADSNGVQKVYPYANSGAINEVNVFVEATTSASTDGKGTPSGTLLTNVEAVVNFNPNTSLALNERGRKPITVKVNYLPITPLTVNININGYVGLTTAIQTVLFTAIKSTIDAIRPFVDAADIVADKNNSIDNNKIISSILNKTPGATFGAITITISGTVYSNYIFTNGDIPSLNSITYV
jgi:uncharacterized phage protein gp47/JayE